MVHASIFRNSGNLQQLFTIFNKQYDIVLDLCDEEAELPDVSKRDLDIRCFQPLKLGVIREQLKEELILE